MENGKNIENRRKLSREELLAGKCFPDDNGSSDPRIKSPDDILGLKALNKTQPMKIQTNDEITAVKNHYEKELTQWRDYDVRVKEWKKQVLDIVTVLKREAGEKPELLQEIERLKRLVREKDEEIAQLRAASEGTGESSGFWQRVTRRP